MEKEILNKYFNYDKFREGQEEIVSSIINHNNTLAIMPTGSGKSICFQVPGLYFEGIINRISAVAIRQIMAQTIQMITGTFVFFLTSSSSS